MKYVSSSIRKFVCRWVGVLLLLVPFIGVPKSWKDSIILIFAIVLLFASFSFDEKQKAKAATNLEQNKEPEDKTFEQKSDSVVAENQYHSDDYFADDDEDDEEYVDNEVEDDEYEHRPL